MTNTLYIYEHCPYCVKARMIFGLKDIPVILHYVLNDDVATPEALIGKKMVPILKQSDGTVMPESMDIVRYIDKSDGKPMVNGELSSEAVAAWLDTAKRFIYRLAMPRWVQLRPPLPEFETQEAIRYFTEKKEGYLGLSFDHAMRTTRETVEIMHEALQALPEIMHSQEGVHAELSEDDFHLYAALHSLSVVKGIEYPKAVEHYRQYFARTSGVPLLDEHAL
jgi:glutaredoxin 2